MKDASGADEEYLVTPHMSLFYGSLSESRRRRIQEAVVLPQSILFSSIRAVLIPEKPRIPEDVTSWKYL